MGRTACTEPQCLYSRAIPLLPLWAVRPVQSLSACTRVHFTFTITLFNERLFYTVLKCASGNGFSSLDAKARTGLQNSICSHCHNFIHITDFTIQRPTALYYFLTPWSRVLLEKLTSLQPLKKFATFYGTPSFIPKFTSARHLSLS
jgi:hypothetical protein